MDFPQDLYYTKDHEWLRVAEGSDEGTVGITEFAQSELGDIVYVEIDEVGNDVGADDVFGTIEAVKTVAELFMPLAGSVLEMNPALDDNPELVNDDPYGEGWLIRIKLSNPEDVSDMLSPADYAAMVDG